MFVKSKGKYYKNNKFQQNILLKALQHTTNLDELKKIAGFHSKVEVLRTLDKLSIRKGYHDALERSGLNLDKIVDKYKQLIDEGSDRVALGAVNAVAKSLGLDKYEVSDSSGKNWEELLLEAEKVESGVPKLAKYEVEVPEIPEEEKIKEAEQQEIGKSLYE